MRFAPATSPAYFIWFFYGGVPERLKGTGCKPVDFGLRRFESYPHQFTRFEIVFLHKKVDKSLWVFLCGSSSVG